MTKGRNLIQRIAVFTIAFIVLFVALSTATYAWYTTTNSVKAGDITFTSSASDDGGSLTIGITTDSNLTTMRFDNALKLSPMIPANLAVIDQTIIKDFLSFQTTYQNLNELGYPIAAVAGVDTTPYNPTVDGRTHFYINNKSESDITVAVNYTIQGALEDKLHVALFTASQQSTDFVFRGIMTNADSVHYGIINIEDKIEDTLTMNDVIVASGDVELVVPANGSISVRLLVWLDGVDTIDEDSNKDTACAFDFVA